MKEKSTITAITYDENGRVLATFLFPKKCRNELKLLKEQDVSVEVKKYSQKRSNNANAYMWELIGQMSEATGIPSDEIYRDAIRNVGFCEFSEMSKDAFIGLNKMWSSIGTGWFVEQVDYAEDGDNLLVRRFYGSSSYDTAQMSRLIDYVVNEAKNIGIETETPEEIDKMKSLWKV